MKCSFKEFIENHVKVMPGGGHIKLTSAQNAFIDFIEKNKGKNTIWLKSRSGGLDCITKLYREYVDKEKLIMAAIDKIYVDSYEKYVEFKEWCEKQPPFTDKYGVKEPMTRYLITGWEKENWVCHPIFSAPYYVDAYVIRNCPFDFIQEELMLNYGHWSQERIKSFYADVKNWNSEEVKCPYWAKLDDFITLEDGTMTIKGLEESDYSKIKKGELYNSPFTSYKYKVGKHFKCIKHPPHFYNFPLNMKNWWVDIILPDGMGFMYYHAEHNSWDFDDEYVIADWSSSTAFIGTIKALKRHMVKWKLPVGTIVRATGRYISDTYEFVIKK